MFISSNRSSNKFLDVLWGGERRGGKGTGEMTQRRRGAGMGRKSLLGLSMKLFSIVSHDETLNQKPHFLQGKCAKTHPQQCSISIIFRGEPPDPRLKGEGKSWGSEKIGRDRGYEEGRSREAWGGKGLPHWFSPQIPPWL